MGQCSLIDLHHDYLSEIDAQPDDFARALTRALRSGDRSVRTLAEVRHYGVTLIETRDSYRDSAVTELTEALRKWKDWRLAGAPPGAGVTMDEREAGLLQALARLDAAGGEGERRALRPPAPLDARRAIRVA